MMPVAKGHPPNYKNVRLLYPFSAHASLSTRDFPNLVQINIGGYVKTG